MSKNAGEPGTLRHLVGQWTAQIGRSLEAIVAVIMMLVDNMLGTSGGVRPHGTQARRMPQVPARLSRPMVAKPPSHGAARELSVGDRRARTMLTLMPVGPLSIVSILQLGRDETRYPKDDYIAT
ncbi:hypothetical protein G5V57_01540 [Nordella sp. HKS 07]|uniref:hypothetical protein n=1 Tax=Nordella sp. HKS 07 TaxID=2712222 RepID=UPI0013E1FC4B|nr:hypothetical protein [Nordella sp. HKS 07]QIG46557.1 hypothetical protein G5V57_01540 [Nordella sp. HKS 07]